MASRDPAFLWETEVLRSTGPRGGSGDSASGGDDWMTLREASEATGIPTSTIRKWARNQNIPSYVEHSEDGDLRMVSMIGITRRAAKLGRQLDPDPPAPRADATRRDADTGQPDPIEGGIEPADPEATMLVPLDAWNRMLNQLGNLHEAGQQLAVATERAARAETEAAFLKERLSELREEIARAREDSSDPGLSQPGDASPESSSSPTSVIRNIYRSWRAQRRGRS